MEKQLEKIDLEYSLYEVEPVGSVDEAIEYIFGIFDEADHYKELFDYMRKKNKKDRRVSKLFGRLRGLYIYNSIDPKFYDESDVLLDKQVKLLDGLYDCIWRISQEVDDDNFVEMHKLACFTREKYRINDSRYEEERSRIRLHYRGAEITVANSIDDSEAFGVFFDKKIADASYVQSVEKVKK